MSHYSLPDAFDLTDVWALRQQLKYTKQQASSSTALDPSAATTSGSSQITSEHQQTSLEAPSTGDTRNMEDDQGSLNTNELESLKRKQSPVDISPAQPPEKRQKLTPSNAESRWLSTRRSPSGAAAAPESSTSTSSARSPLHETPAASSAMELDEERHPSDTTPKTTPTRSPTRTSPTGFATATRRTITDFFTPKPSNATSPTRLISSGSLTSSSDSDVLVDETSTDSSAASGITYIASTAPTPPPISGKGKSPTGKRAGGTAAAAGVGSTLPSDLDAVCVTRSAKLFEEFRRDVLTAGTVAVIAAVYQYDCTNFRKTELFTKHGGNGDAPPLHRMALALVVRTIKQKGKPYAVELVGGGDEVPLEQRWAVIDELFANEQVTKLVFNAQEVVKLPLVARQRGLSTSSTSRWPHFRQVYDPKVAAYLFNPELDSFEFSALVGYFLSEKPATLSGGVDSHVRHVAVDLILCSRLFAKLRGLLEKEELWGVFEQQEMPLVGVLAKMELAGIGFDRDGLLKFRRKLQRRLDELRRQADALMGRPMTLSSPKKMAHVLFDELKLEAGSGKMTKKGTQQSTSEEVLLSLKDKHALPALILEYRHCSKLLSTYVDALAARAMPVSTVDADSHTAAHRLYTTWQHCATATGRLASCEPNLQNLPKQPISLSLPEVRNSGSEGSTPTPPPTDVSINVRDAFVAAEGYTFLAADYSQMEMRILAHMSHEEILLEFFREGKDIHNLIAGRWLNKPADEVTPLERERAKHIVYGILYGMGPKSLGEILKVSPTEAREFISNFLKKFPKIDEFLKETTAHARRDGFVRTLLRRRRLLPNIHSAEPEERARSERQAVNSVIQGTAADMVKLAMISIDEKLNDPSTIIHKSQLVLQLHDELVYEVALEELDAMKEIVKSTMESVLKLDVEVPVRLSTGTRYGSLTPVPEPAAAAASTTAPPS